MSDLREGQEVDAGLALVGGEGGGEVSVEQLREERRQRRHAARQRQQHLPV